jgi:hypothetical protein
MFQLLFVVVSFTGAEYVPAVSTHECVHSTFSIVPAIPNWILFPCIALYAHTLTEKLRSKSYTLGRLLPVYHYPNTCIEVDRIHMAILRMYSDFHVILFRTQLFCAGSGNGQTAEYAWPMTRDRCSFISPSCNARPLLLYWLGISPCYL